MTVLLFVVTIIILVGVHECGHFLAARALGVYVHEFAIGMGPVLVSRKRGETTYALRLIPIGGYVRMAGEDRLETGEAVPADRVLYNKPAYVRVLISLAGPVMNAVLALVALLAVSWAMSFPVPQVADTIAGEPAAAVFQSGDRILAIDGRPVYAQSEITRGIAASAGRPVEFLIRRGGAEQIVSVTPRAKDDGSGYLIGAYFASSIPTPEIVRLEASSPLFFAGAAAGDRIVAVGDAPVTTGLEAAAQLTAAFAATDPVAITLERAERKLTILVRANGRTVDEILEGATFGDLGVETRRAGFAAGLGLGWQSFVSYAGLLVVTLRDLVSGSAEAREAISGPLGIADVLSKSFAYGFLFLLEILGFLSLNFAIINLIPFPGLDGSRVVFALVEWIRGKPIPPQKEGIIHAIGFVVLLILLVVITYRDIIRLFG